MRPDRPRLTCSADKDQRAGINAANGYGRGWHFSRFIRRRGRQCSPTPLRLKWVDRYDRAMDLIQNVERLTRGRSSQSTRARKIIDEREKRNRIGRRGERYGHAENGRNK